MSEKYIDLGPRIFNTTGLDMPSKKRLASIHCVLRWLDDHPDQAPGRTITAGEVGRWSHLINGRYIETPSIIDFLEALGITVVPDPEPTNEEKLDRDIQEVDLHLTSRQLAEALIERGWTKTPGATDDQ